MRAFGCLLEELIERIEPAADDEPCLARNWQRCATPAWPPCPRAGPTPRPCWRHWLACAPQRAEQRLATIPSGQLTAGDETKKSPRGLKALRLVAREVSDRDKSRP